VKATEAAEQQKQENKQNVLRKQTPCNPVAATLRPGFFFVIWAAAQKLQGQAGEQLELHSRPITPAIFLNSGR